MSATAQPVAVPKPARMAFLDNLKVFLTFLVILHHAGQAYGPGGMWYVENPERTPWLGPFFWVNASYFMGLFFMISAYFMPGSVDRRGPWHFLKDRLLRFGVPLVVFLLTIIPLIMYGHYVNFRGGTAGYFEYFIKYFFGIGTSRPAGWAGATWPDMQFIHLWFIEHLLVYSVVYALWRSVFKRPAAGRRPLAAPSDLALAGYLLLLVGVSGLVRLTWPIDRWTGFLGFIQMEPAHLPQYLSLFVLGVVAYRNQWMTTMPRDRGLRWFGIGLVGVVGAVTMSVGSNLHWLPWNDVAAIFIECIIATGFAVGLPVLFREYFSGQGGLMKALTADAYAAYLFHVPVLILLEYAVRYWPVGPGVKFFVTGFTAVPLVFLLCHLLRKIPGASRIL